MRQAIAARIAEAYAGPAPRTRPSTHYAIPGNWGSVSGGKWHLTHSEQPDPRRDETALCGLTFRPLNVCWGEAPPTNDHYVCLRCLAGARDV